MLKIEVLVTTMHQSDISKYHEMNLQTDAVIANQADHCGYEEYTVDGKHVRFVTTDTRGVSLNRNIAIFYSSADIIVFADDDQVFVDGYEKTVLEAFETNPDADAIKFYCESTNPQRPLSYKKADNFCQATILNSMSAGIHGLAVKRESLIKKSVLFDINLGPGRKIFCGEDSVFIKELFRRKLSCYHSPELISYVNQEQSTWFSGYNEQFFVSSGYVYKRLYGVLAPLAIFRRVYNIRIKRKCTLSFHTMISLMMKGFFQGYKDR